MRYRTVERAVRNVLLHDWDPIWVADIPEAADEYDTYVAGVCGLLFRRASAEDIAAHLRCIEIEQMGLPGSDRERQHRAAQKLLAAFAEPQQIDGRSEPE